MKVHNVEMIMSAVRPDQYPSEGYPEFALAGRSNVGKSSFINKMIGRKSLARTSSKPGKTQTLNFYKIEEQVFFVDVPGYGYAKVAKSSRETWGKFIQQYMTEREPLRAVILIVDLRHAPSADDCAMYDFLVENNMPAIIIATKADKIPKGKWEKHKKVVRETLAMRPYDALIVFSSEKGIGMDEAWKEIESRM
ncbi:YihA family ribosome biogenesis GTP-binding protein [Sporosarcina sp. E16_3]|uniref:ribosome biogenesis GTP-binding protein YihA/YsxC n=1 Tax=unclassified Sporosarcina TaxID=2647733 RepID=UPI0016465D71|nr:MULTISPECIES: ribosome biogenesis GTP-binding protein YihA/YsxC [unclassified Sporosarcina]MBO0601352.1 YihA family ribosome biogenesis GTP-binding protein [Sporosarcina sp. E16_3]